MTNMRYGLFVDHHARIGTLAQLHTNHTGRQRPSWVTKRQLSWGAVLSLRIIITPLSSTFRRSLSQFVLCHRGPAGWGLGRLAPDSQPGLKIAPKIAGFWGFWRWLSTGSSLQLVFTMCVLSPWNFIKFIFFSHIHFSRTQHSLKNSHKCLLKWKLRIC